jgi:K+-transporting ATPase ATPase C chain
MRDLVRSGILLFLFTVLLGVIYPFAVWGVAQILFPFEANGSLVERDGQIVGSELIGQNFTLPGYFHSRPSAAGNGYDAAASSGSNLGPTSRKLIDRIRTDSEILASENPDMPIPADLVTTSGSGLDPHISPEGAAFQVPRIAVQRKRGEDIIRKMVAENTEGRQFRIFGEPRVNVLKLNLALDREFGPPIK